MTDPSNPPSGGSGGPAQPVRIVSLQQGPHALASAAAAVQPAAPQLVYNGGPLLANVEVFTVFWGSAWGQGDLANLASDVNGFFQFIVTSPLIDQLAEYQTPTFAIGQGSFSGTATLTDADPPNVVSDQQIQDLLTQRTASGELPAPDANLLYFVFTPPSVVVTLGADQSCVAFCGYHDQIGGNLFYAVVPYPDCAGCQAASGVVLDAITTVASHELCEGITDPIPGQGWYWFADAQNQGEIGDLCVGQTKQVGPYTVQTEWSNAAGGCV
jgi:hypothetical protein